MVSHQYKCIFIHIPKCAGTSIEEALGHFSLYNGRGKQDHRTLRQLEPLSLNTFSNIENIKEFVRGYRNIYFNKVLNPKNKYVVNKSQFDSYFKFTIVRNPYTRVFSWYKNVIRDKEHQKKLEVDSQISFPDFVKRFIGTGMLRSQLYYIVNYKGDVDLDRVIKFEEISNDFPQVAKILDLDISDLPHNLKGSTSDYQEYYDTETFELVSKHYKEEIKLFNYTF